MLNRLPELAYVEGTFYTCFQGRSIQDVAIVSLAATSVESAKLTNLDFDISSVPLEDVGFQVIHQIHLIESVRVYRVPYERGHFWGNIPSLFCFGNSVSRQGARNKQIEMAGRDDKIEKGFLHRALHSNKMSNSRHTLSRPRNVRCRMDRAFLNTRRS